MVDILLIEDNRELAGLLCAFMEREGYTVYHAGTGECGMDYFAHNTVRIVLLDIMLPGIDGFGVCEQIRGVENTPVILLSAKVDKEDKITGLGLGADDYIEKPYDLDVLLAKIRAHLRRTYEMGQGKGNFAENQIKDGDIILDKDTRRIYRKGMEYPATAKEYELLLLFMENQGKTLRKEWIFNKIWGIDSFSEPSTLNVHINKLREKVEDTPKDPKRIVTVWGVGYRYEKLS